MPPPDSLLLKLSVAKNLIDQDLAKEVYAQSQAESRPALDILLERGVLTPHIAENLLKEVERAQSPKTIGGFCQRRTKIRPLRRSKFRPLGRVAA